MVAIDKTDWLRAEPSGAPDLPKQQQFAARESVRSEALVGHEGWDSFLTYIEAALKEAREIKAQAREKFEKSPIVNAEQLLAIKMVMAEANAVEAALEHVVRLPYAIIHEQAEVTGRKIPVPKMPEFLTKE